MVSEARLVAPFDDGFVVGGTGLELDPRHCAEIGVATDPLGEAHAARVVATPTTVRILQRRRRRSSWLPAPPHRPFTIGAVDVEMIPSGAVPGGAQVLLRHHGLSILYARRVLPDRLWPIEPLEVPRADVVLLDAPGGFPVEACSRRADALAGLRSWVERALGRNAIPVVLAEPIIAAPAAVLALGSLGCDIRVHRTIYEVLQAFAPLGMEVPRVFQLRGEARLGQVVVLPYPLGPAGGFERIPGRETALLHDGSVPVGPGAGIDESFLLAFAAGVPELVAHVQRTGASEVHVSPGTPTSVGDILRDLGVPIVVREGPPRQVTFAS